MTEKDVIRELNLHKDGRYSEDGYEYILNDSDEWGKIYSIFEKNKNITELEGSTLKPNESEFDFIYESPDEEKFLIRLTGLFDEDDYRISISKYED